MYPVQIGTVHYFEGEMEDCMKRLGYAWFLAFLMFGAVRADDGAVTVTRKDLGIKIQMPSGWETVKDSTIPAKELWLNVPVENENIICYFKRLKAPYARAKANLLASFRAENFASFEKMYGALEIEVHRKSSCEKINGIEVCSAEYKYNYQQAMDQHTYYAVFSGPRGAVMAFFSAGPDNYPGKVEIFKNSVMKSLASAR